MGLGIGLGEQQGKKMEKGGLQEEKVEGSEKKSSFGRLEEVRVERPSALPRVCIVGTGIFGRQGPQNISKAIVDNAE